MRDWSGEATMIRPWPFSEWFHDVITPVVRSNATRFARGVSLTPGSAPAGRALVKRPVAYTVLPTVTIDHTTPLTCTVGSASALTVSGLAGDVGVGMVSARAPGASRASTPATRRKISAPDSVLMDAVDDDRDIPGFPRFDTGYSSALRHASGEYYG